MTDNIVIVGSGFAAYQLIKSIRRQDNEVSICVITADEGHDYNKPDLSHVFSKAQKAADLVLASAAQFAQQYNVDIMPQTRVEHIDIENKTVTVESKCIANEHKKLAFTKLVLATGAAAFIPPMQGDAADCIYTLNSLTEFSACHENINTAGSILVIGGGLIGVEIALDLANAGKKVALVEPAPHVMFSQLPKYAALELQQKLTENQVQIFTNTRVESLTHDGTQKLAQLSDARDLSVDEVFVCAGLKPHTQLAKKAGIKINRGICVDSTLQTSVQDIYALGDCAEINGTVRSYLQPILLSANVLSKTLLGTATALNLPNMMTKVKTPNYPIQIGGITTGNTVNSWRYDVDEQGMIAKAMNADEHCIGFVVTQDKTNQAFSLLRELS